MKRRVVFENIYMLFNAFVWAVAAIAVATKIKEWTDSALLTFGIPLLMLIVGWLRYYTLYVKGITMLQKIKEEQ